MRCFLDPVEDQRAASAKTVQREAEQHREQQHLQNFAFRERVDDGGRNDVEQKIGRALQLSRFGVGGDALRVERGGVDVHPGTGLDHVNDREADDQRDRADDLEVEQRVTAGLAHFLHVFHAGDANHDRAENDRRNHHLDQLDEAVAQWSHFDAPVGLEISEQHANHDGNDDLEVQRLVQRFLLLRHRVASSDGTS